MRLKKIYIEITNGCNLNCDFCIHNKHKVTNISIDNYKKIINKIKGYTKEIYLHILGEPLMHKDINYFIDYANSNGILVNITTNGYLISKIKDNHNIHRLNISLHSYDSKYGVELDKYMNNIFDVIDLLRDRTFVLLRLWVKNYNNEKMLKYINDRYLTNIKRASFNGKVKIASNLVIDGFHEFIWPEIDNGYYNVVGTCKGLIDHIGILSDGRIVPCCLDAKGILTLGNIYTDSLSDVFSCDTVKKMVDVFRKNYKCEELCRHCNFLSNIEK